MIDEQTLIDFIRENADSVADLADLHEATTSNNPYYRGFLLGRLQQKYLPLYLEANGDDSENLSYRSPE